MELWVGCVAGALQESEYASKLKAAGFADVEVDPWRIYNIEDARAMGVIETRYQEFLGGK